MNLHQRLGCHSPWASQLTRSRIHRDSAYNLYIYPENMASLQINSAFQCWYGGRCDDHCHHGSRREDQMPHAGMRKSPSPSLLSSSRPHVPRSSRHLQLRRSTPVPWTVLDSCSEKEASGACTEELRPHYSEVYSHIHTDIQLPMVPI